MAGMNDLDIRDFTTVASVLDSDHVVLSLFSGKSGKMKVGLFRSVVAKGIAPSVSPDGYWLVGELNTGVLAEGKTPELRKAEDGIEMKYANEGDEHWHMLVPFSDLKMMFEDLNPEQIDEIRLKYEDLTEEQVKELQKPATDMIAVLEKTNKDVAETEALRVEAENERGKAEEARIQAELLRQEAADRHEQSQQEWSEAESARESNEAERQTAEALRREAETDRVETDEKRKEDYERIRSSLVTESMIVVIPEEEYENAVNAGTIDGTKLYFAYEEE